MSFQVLSAELAYISNSSSAISKFSAALRSPLLNQQGTHPDSPVDRLLIKIDHFDETIMYLAYPLNFYIIIVSNFSWELIMQNFGE